MVFSRLPEEGHGFAKKVFSGSFEFSNSGGCRNFPTYDKNPAYCLRLKQDAVVFFRLMITSEVARDG